MVEALSHERGRDGTNYLCSATYKEVCSGRTGHAEVVQVVFDPAKVTYKQLLEVFWANHDPIALNRRGADIGTQYRPAWLGGLT